MSELAEKSCLPCRGGVPPLDAEAIRPLHAQIPAWQVVNDHHLTRQFHFSNFATALRFVNQIGDIAEAQGHHPDVELVWGRVGLKVWTHKINGLTESDFVYAAKVDRVWPGAEGRQD
jgi:4a-hydroxytetrahydrobiopterin dehydratase